MQTKAEDFIRSSLPKGPFIGVHMRNGVDWSRACEHVVNAPTLFASAQCLGKISSLYHAFRGLENTDECKKPIIMIFVHRAPNCIALETPLEKTPFT